MTLYMNQTTQTPTKCVICGDIFSDFGDTCNPCMQVEGDMEAGQDYEGAFEVSEFHNYEEVDWR